MQTADVTVRHDYSAPVVDDREVEIDLIELFYALLRSYKLILAFVFAVTLLAGIYTKYIAVPMYESTAKLYVLNSRDSAINLSDLQIGSYLTNDYQQVFKTWEVHEQVRQNLGLDYSYRKLESMLRVENPANTRILQLTVRSDSPDEAKAMANEYANVAQQYISETMQTEKPSILSVALKPLSPSSPSLSKNLMIGFMLGLLIPCAIVFIRFISDDKIKTTEDITKYAGLSTLAVVPMRGKMEMVKKASQNARKKAPGAAARARHSAKAVPPTPAKANKGAEESK